MISRILLAANGSEYSARAVRMAAEVAGRFGAEIIVFHAHEHAMGRGGGYEVETLAEADALTDRVVRELKDVGLSARGQVRSCFYGHTAREIVGQAKDEGADLIVMGSRGLSDVAGLLLGSVAHKVLQLAHVPVLVTR
jgi:nucleotide-binding universal stress UspA family protein